MKKDLLFSIPLILIGVLLFLLRMTGMTAHIILSVIGLALLVAYAVASKKDWKLPVLEILMRVFYGIALISGIIIMNVHGIPVLAVVHKAGAALYVVLLAVLLIRKAKTSR
ncbi:MAG: hypothetical protein IKU40_03715 [Clostridia bacterium]|nr:hypothetical protein [Clostridia bacterium]